MDEQKARLRMRYLQLKKKKALAQQSQPEDTGIVSTLAKGAIQGLGIYNRSQFGSPQDLLGRADQMIRSGANKAGEFVAEEAGRQGMNPYAAAGMGTFMQMTPDIIATAVQPGGEISTPRVARQTMNTIRKPLTAMTAPLLKATKGIPPQVTRMAVANPEIMTLPGTSQSVQGRAQGIIDAVKGAQKGVSAEFGAAYKQAGMNSPVDDIVENGSKISKSFEELRRDYHAAARGDLFKTQDVSGATSEASTVEKLAKLTDLKRSLQDKAIYPQAGAKLSQSEGAHNAAIKNMAADIDRLRGTIPGGEKLAIADDAWAEMTELKQRLISAFRDPYTGQDYLNRILKGNTDWLTSGRMAGKIGAIERIEQMTGKEVLKPALEEMAAAYLKNPDTMGLASTGLKSIITSLIPTKLFLGRLSGAAGRTRGPLKMFSAGFSKVSHHNEGGRDNGNYNPRNEIKNGQQPNNKGNSYQGQNNSTSNFDQVTPKIFGQKEAKIPTREILLDYLRKARGDKDKARKMAISDGYDISKRGDK